METDLLRFFWHPVCTEAELAAADGGTIGVCLLGEQLVVAVLGGVPVAFPDRCLHRSTRLSLGSVDHGCLRCANHGWRWAADGTCVEVPTAPDDPIPSRARLGQVDCAAAHGLVWARLDGAAATSIPACRPASQPGPPVAFGRPRTCATDPFRLVEHLTDRARVAGALGAEGADVGTASGRPECDLRREAGELRFEFCLHSGEASCRVPMPCTVDLSYELPDGTTRGWWLTASPVAPGETRFFLLAGSTGDHEPDVAAQEAWLAQQEPFVVGPDQGRMPLDGHTELSVGSDAVSLEYRRWLRELRAAAALGADVLADLVSLDAEESILVGPDAPAPHTA